MRQVPGNPGTVVTREVTRDCPCFKGGAATRPLTRERRVRPHGLHCEHRLLGPPVPCREQPAPVSCGLRVLWLWQLEPGCPLAQSSLTAGTGAHGHLPQGAPPADSHKGAGWSRGILMAVRALSDEPWPSLELTHPNRHLNLMLPPSPSL